MLGFHKKLLRHLLDAEFVSRKLKRYYRTVDKMDLLAGLITNNGWLFSQPKSGTNFICNVLSAYNFLQLHGEGFTLDDRYRMGVVHSGRVTSSPEGLAEALSFKAQTTRILLCRTHHLVPSARPKVLILTNRKLLDQFCSYYHFQYRPLGISVEKAIPKMAVRYAERSEQQEQAARTAERTLRVEYEDLICAPNETFSKIVTALYTDLNKNHLKEAIGLSNTERFKSWESATGTPYLPPNLLHFEKSFIRSGKVGEGILFFSDSQIVLIQKHMQRLGIDVVI